VRVRGDVVSVGPRKSVSTGGGERELAELTVAPTSGDEPPHDGPVDVTLWGDWVETVDVASEGMTLLVTAATETEFQGETGYATTGDSRVVLEPDRLVSVTAIRQWVQCPRLHYLQKIDGTPLNEPVVRGTLIHEVFGDLLRGLDREAAIERRLEDARLELDLLELDVEGVRAEMDDHTRAIEGWLQQGTLTDGDEWRSEYSLASPTVGMRGRADAIRRGNPVELKTGKNTAREPRFQDKVQAACYALMLEETGGVGRRRSADGGTVADTDAEDRNAENGDTDGTVAAGDATTVDTGTLLYTKNAALDRTEADGDLSPAKDFSIGRGLTNYVLRQRNALAAFEHDRRVPTGEEADATCEYCFEQDTCRVVAGRLDQHSKAGSIGRALPPAERAYFERFYRLIEDERDAIHAAYARLWHHSGSERADNDRALVDLDPVDRERGDDGRWTLTLDRPPGETSKLREGDYVIASDGDPIRGHSEIARIERLDRDRVVASVDEPLECRRLDTYPSSIGVDRMLTALHDGVLKSDDRRRDLLLGRAAPAFDSVPQETFVENNAAQNEAIELGVSARDCALIQGPPGTGKTHTIARLIAALVERGDRVLLSAFTNRAVDNALSAVRDRFRTDGIDVEPVRMGSESGVRDDLQDLRLESLAAPAERADRLTDAQVVAATTATCGSRVMRTQDVDVAVVDEAAQLTEPATLAAINRADRFVLVGDHQQLPPVVRTEGPLSRSLFERLAAVHPEASIMLERQYRMAQRIQAFSSREFYDGRLRPATADVATRSLETLAGVDADALPADLRDPVSVHDPGGTAEGHTNPAEAEAVADLIASYRDAGVDPADVGVIAPYRAQVGEIARRVPASVTVDTVDRFQGSSEAVILVSFVETDDLAGPLFAEHRRVNVALTRARNALVLVGSRGALRSSPFYERLLEWAE
jgi:DNA replication ATP-dependent helicase Dna2